MTYALPYGRASAINQLMTRTLTRIGVLLAVLLLSLMMLSGTSPGPATTTSAKAKANAPAVRLEQSLTRLPAGFEVNAGQADARVKFISRGAGHTLMLTSEGATLALRTGDVRKEGAIAATSRRAPGENASGRRAHAPSFQLVGMKFVGANTRAEVAGEGRLDGRVNYFVGRDPTRWRAGLSTFSSVRYRELYRGVDLVYHDGGGNRLEYDFVLASGADYRPIRLRFDGADRLSLGEGGELLLHTKTGTIRQSAPVVYQERGGARHAVAGRYVLRGSREVGFQLGEYDRSLPLVIDPVLVYSTYFLTASEMAVDASGNVYVAGTAESFAGDFPVTPGAFQQTRRGRSDAFVAKLDASGTALSYLTYLGGRCCDPSLGSEDARGLAVDAAGNAYVTGITLSSDFPVVNAFQPTSGAGADGFVAKLNANGSALIYSSYLGGKGIESGGGIALDATGAAYIVGGTDSSDFPLKNALQLTQKGSQDFFVTKVAPDGKSLEYSTYLGGNGFELGFLAHIAVDAAGAIYVAGGSTSLDYPVTPGAFQQTAKPPDVAQTFEAVLTKIAPGGATLVYSTYLGGNGRDIAYGVALDAAGQAHVVGETNSTDFPTQNALVPTARDPGGNGFIAKLNAAGTALVYSTYLSGTPKRLCGSAGLVDLFPCSGEAALAVATDTAGNAYVTGNTVSGDFPPTEGAVQPTLKGFSDAYVLKLSPTGQALYSTYLGGNSYDAGTDIHVDSAGTIYLLGNTASDDFPTVNPFRDGSERTFFSGPYHGFVAKLSEADAVGQRSLVHFESAAYVVGEAGRFARVSVTRSGDLSQEVSVDYSTSDGAASERTDYTTARGRLSFAPGEAVKTFDVLVTDDLAVEGDESLALTLHDLRGVAVLAAPAAATLTIADDDEHPSASNPIDTSAFFVRQHYLDFLGREPDDAGFQFWTGEIEQCGADAQCREVRRVNVSAAFFLSIEFQETGFLVARLHRLAFGSQVPFRTFARDAHEVGAGIIVGQGAWRERLDVNRRAYAEEFVSRAAFRDEFHESLTAAQYVERLNAKASGALSTNEFAALVAGLEAGTETRATALLKVADDADFRAREFAPAFVLMQYLGYLRRDPVTWPDNGDGYNFWLAKLNSFGGDYIRAEMVKAFITSDEYRQRFHEPAIEAALGTPFKLRFGETVIVQPARLRLSLLDVGFDSRCPRDVQCVDAGSVSILVQAVKPGGETARFVLSIPGLVPRPHPSNPPVEALGYKFRLLQLDPEPLQGAQTPPTEALLQVDPS